MLRRPTREPPLQRRGQEWQQDQWPAKSQAKGQEIEDATSQRTEATRAKQKSAEDDGARARQRDRPQEQAIDIGPDVGITQ